MIYLMYFMIGSGICNLMLGMFNRNTVTLLAGIVALLIAFIISTSVAVGSVL